MKGVGISARQLKAARALLGWSQAQLAKEAGLSTTAVFRLEADMSDARLSTLEAILGALERRGIEFVSSADGTIGVVMRARPDKAVSDQRATA